MKELLKKNRKHIIVLALILVFAIGIGGAAYSLGNNERKLEMQLNLGQKYLQELDYEQAQLAFEQAIAIDPKCAEAYEGAANAYVGMNRYDDAFDILQQGIEATSGDEILISDCIQIGIKLADIYAQDNDFENGLKVYDVILSYNINAEGIQSFQTYMNQYVDQLIDEKNYDKVFELEEKYENTIDVWDSVDNAEQVNNDSFQTSDPEQLVEEEIYSYGLQVLDESGNRFELPNGAEWIEVESHLQSTPVSWKPDGTAYNALVGELCFYCADGQAYYIYVCDEVEDPDPNDTSYMLHLNNYSGNTITLKKTQYQTVDTLFPGGYTVNVATRDCYYISNGETVTIDLVN